MQSDGIIDSSALVAKIEEMIMGEVKNYPPYLDYPKPYKVKTNADRIREMSDEELRNWLLQRDCKKIAAFLQHGAAGVMDAA